MAIVIWCNWLNEHVSFCVAVMQTERQELLSFEMFHHYCFFTEQRPSLKSVKQINRQNTQQQHKYALLMGGKRFCWMVGQTRSSKRNTPFHLFMSTGLANISSSPRCSYTRFISVIEYRTILSACHFYIACHLTSCSRLERMLMQLQVEQQIMIRYFLIIYFIKMGQKRETETYARIHTCIPKCSVCSQSMHN